MNVTVTQLINNCTKLQEWVDVINDLNKEVTYMQTVWKTTVQIDETNPTKTKQVYKFSEPFPLTGKFLVIFSGIVINEEDYEIDGDSIRFFNDFLLINVGYPIEIHYIGNTSIKNIGLYGE